MRHTSNFEFRDEEIRDLELMRKRKARKEVAKHKSTACSKRRAWGARFQPVPIYEPTLLLAANPYCGSTRT